MPELPEVEVVRRGLEPHVRGHTITRIDVHEPRSLRRQAGGVDRLRALVVGTRVTGLERRGKFLWWRLAEPDGGDLGEALMTHLGMSGQLRVREPAVPANASDRREADATHVASTDPGAPTAPAATSEGIASDPHKHCRVSLLLDDGVRVDFLDQRIFGGLWTSELVESHDGLPATALSADTLLPADVRAVGRDLLDPAADLDGVARTMQTRRAPIKSLLLDQHLASGIGNIYADEGLWAARTRFDTPGGMLSTRRARSVLRGTAEVMRRALEVGGTSFDALYVNVDGRSGYFARSLAVYGREGEPCPRCGTAIRRVEFANRSSHYCPRCQRRP
jgi:formamidopyrimidine-DNA glycosylase